MARMTTVYDKDINEKVFKVRGDEAYAHTTDTTLSIQEFTNSDDSIEGYRVGIKYNVLRDIGASKVLLYDDDTLLATYDWTDTNTETTVGNSTSGGFLLSYGEPHNLRMVYKGNNQCLGSKSRVVQFEKDIPQKFQTELEITSLSNVNLSNNKITLSATVRVNGQTTNNTKNRDVLIYVDDTYVDTKTTNSSSNLSGVQVTLDEDLSYGSHTITCEVAQAPVINYATDSDVTNKGYKIQVNYPTPFVYGKNNNITGKITTFDGEAVANPTVAFANGSTQINMVTDANGNFELETPVTGMKAIQDEMKFGLIVNSGYIEYFDYKQVKVDSLTVDADTDTIYNEPMSIQAKLVLDQSDEVVVGSAHYPLTHDTNGIIVTMGNKGRIFNIYGNAVFPYTPSSVGGNTVSIESCGETASKTIWAYNQIWKDGTEKNRDYTIVRGDIVSQRNGYLLKDTNNSLSAYSTVKFLLPRKDFTRIRLLFDIVTTELGTGGLEIILITEDRTPIAYTNHMSWKTGQIDRFECWWDDNDRLNYAVYNSSQSSWDVSTVDIGYTPSDTTIKYVMIQSGGRNVINNLRFYG